jgi:hypothetical protein
MQAKEFISYISEPRTLNQQSVKQLQDLVNDFPYFESAHILLSLASRKWDASVYQQSLKKTAIVVTNRSRLFNLIHGLESEEITGTEAMMDVPLQQPENENAKQELDILKAAEISTEEQSVTIPEPKATPAESVVEKEIAKQVVAAFVEKELLKTHETGRITPLSEPPGSFGDWLAFLKKNNGQPYAQIKEDVDRGKQKQQERTEAENKSKQEIQAPDDVQARKRKNQALIDKIIEKNPGLIRSKDEPKFYTPEAKAKESLLNNEHLVTETLARIYALQGNVNKAIRAYEILSLKYPQKSAYFASLIEKLKTNQ